MSWCSTESMQLCTNNKYKKINERKKKKPQIFAQIIWNPQIVQHFELTSLKLLKGGYKTKPLLF